MNREQIEKYAQQYADELTQKYPNWFEYVDDSWINDAIIWFAKIYKEQTDGWSLPLDSEHIFKHRLTYIKVELYAKKHGIHQGYLIIRDMIRDIANASYNIDEAIHYFTNADNPENKELPIDKLKELQPKLEEICKELQKIKNGEH